MAQMRPEDKARQTLEGIRAKMFLRFGERGSRIIVRICIAAMILAVIAVAAILFIRIKTIEVTGDVTMFNESEIIEAAGIDVGDGLYWKSSGRIKRNIQKNMPIAQNVKVRKNIFGKVTINVELISVDYYMKLGEKYYALDADLLVLDENTNPSKYSAFGAVLVKLPEVRQPVVGEKLVFYDTVEETDTEGETVYEIKEESFYEYTTKFLKNLKESGFHSDANGVILTQKFDITLIYAEKFSICFGNVNDLDEKFRVLYEILAEGSMQYAEKCSIDLTNPSRATARADLTLDFSEFID